MKKVEAIIKPFLLEEVKDALQSQGLIGMTISEIMNFQPGEASGVTGLRKKFSGSGKSDFTPRLKIELVLNNEDVTPAIRTIQRTGMTLGSDESLTVQTIDDVIRIRTSEHGEGAI